MPESYVVGGIEYEYALMDWSVIDPKDSPFSTVISCVPEDSNLKVQLAVTKSGCVSIACAMNFIIYPMLPIIPPIKKLYY